MIFMHMKPYMILLEMFFDEQSILSKMFFDELADN